MPHTPKRHRMRQRSSLGVIHSLVACVCIAAGASGCATSGSQARPGVSDAYTRSYAQGRYQSAYTGAVAAAKTSEPRAHEHAALIAGLAAKELRHDADARRWLTPLTSSGDHRVSGRAAAALGMLETENGHDDQAAMLLRQAATDFNGDDAAQAGLRAGDASTRLGRRADARVQYSRARSLATGEALRTALDARLGGDHVTLQLGAYRNRSNAERAARSARKTTQRLGAGSPRIVTRTDRSGRVVYLVQVGSFDAKAAAMQERRRLGLAAIVVSN